jgi:hypothetical protein
MSRIIVVILLLMPFMGFTQERVTTFGVALKPIVPSNLFRAGEVAISQNGIDYELNQRVGYSFGGVMRFGMTKWLSLESGISFVRRNFSATVFHEELAFADTTGFRVIGYEIPIQGLVFVQLSDEIFMNTSFGLALDMFPSDVANGNSVDFIAVGRRRGIGGSNSIMTWTKLGLLANIGFEYRTKEKGYFYIGASYHRPFQPIYDTELIYTDRTDRQDRTTLQMSGNYLTIDFRYFFHEEPKEKKVERNPDTMPSWMKK